MGKYHNRHFHWPPADVMLLWAEHLREEMRSRKALRCARSQSSSSTTLQDALVLLGLPPKVNIHIVLFLRFPELVWTPPPVCPEKVTRVALASADRSAATRRHRSVSPPGDFEEFGVKYLQEFATKSNGRWAGSCQVRHRRCGFNEYARVCTGSSVVHRLTTHIIRKVQTGVQRPTAQQKWPSKRALILERARARALKFDYPPHHEATRP